MKNKQTKGKTPFASKPFSQGDRNKRPFDLNEKNKQAIVKAPANV